MPKILQKNLAQYDLDPVDESFMINLFDSILGTLKANQAYSAQALEEIERKFTAHLLEHQQILNLLQQQSAELETLRQLSLHLSSSLDLNTILKAVVSDAMKILENSRTAHIFLYSEEEDKLTFGAAHSRDGALKKSFAEPRQNGLTYQTARSAKEIIVPDMRKHPIYINTPPTWSGSIIGIPLMHEEHVVGVMSLSRSHTGKFSNRDLHLLDLLAEQATVAISNARIHAKVTQQAKSDTLTGLPNRRALDEHLEQEIQSAQRTGHSFTVTMMDLDGFKKVNDKHGHPVGDQVLRVLSNYISSGLRTSDFLARYGGDELTLVLSKSDLQATKLVTDKILKKISDFQFKLPNGAIITLGISGGTALYPVHGQNASELLRAADAALYRAKTHQRGTFMIAKASTGKLS